MKTGYDPFNDAEGRGIQIHYRTLRASNGMWVPDLNVIFLQPRMRRIQERSVLAHEVAHAALGHRDDRPKHEVLADRLAADNLIDRDELLDLMAWTGDTARICLELGVSTKLLRVYANVHRLTGYEAGERLMRSA
jgi:Zn-dependent peptidase ImmA (M78 family)